MFKKLDIILKNTNNVYNKTKYLQCFYIWEEKHRFGRENERTANIF